MRRAIVAAVLLAALAVPGTAHAAPPPEGPVNGPFSPTFHNSPVTLVICTVPGACVVGPR